MTEGPVAALGELVAVMDRLRSPGGCPWDAEQSHASLVRYLLEEAYEVADSVAADDRAALREELGDVLLQVVFHARIAEEHPTDPWDVGDVARGVTAKLVRRHPHVFAEAEAADAAAVAVGWDEIKRKEKGRRSVTEGVPRAQPALALLAALVGRADRAGLGHVVDAYVAEPGSPPAPGVLPDGRLAGLLRDVVAAERAGLDVEVALRAAAVVLADRLDAAVGPS